MSGTGSQDQGRFRTWLSLLTVRVIHAQVKPGRSVPGKTAISTTYPPPAT
jgi:hypothetical protein